MLVLLIVISTSIVALGVWQAFQLGPFFRAELTRVRAGWHGRMRVPLRIERTILSLLGRFSSRVEALLGGGQKTREDRIESKFGEQEANLEGQYRRRLKDAWRRQEEQTE